MVFKEETKKKLQENKDKRRLQGGQIGMVLFPQHSGKGKWFEIFGKGS